MREAVKERRAITVRSAGVSAVLGQPPSWNSVEALREWGIDIAGQRSQPLTERLVKEATHIFVMTRSHRETVAMFFPDAAGRQTERAG